MAVVITRRSLTERVEAIRGDIFSILAEFEFIVDKRCIDNCEHCFLNEVIIPESEDPYEYASGKLYGPLTICDFLGILQDEL